MTGVTVKVCFYVCVCSYVYARHYYLIRYDLKMLFSLFRLPIHILKSILCCTDVLSFADPVICCC